jgi:hypothetical protein
LSLSEDGIVLSWLEEVGEGSHELRMSVAGAGGWSAPATVAAGADFFVNWADFPALLALGDQDVVVSYPWKSGEGTYAYDVWLRRSADGGATWGEPVRPHTDGTATEHGFVTLLREGSDVRAVWLDGRNAAGHGGHDDHDAGPGPDMTLRTARIDADGALHDERVLDGRVCDCCQTAGVPTPSGPLIAYRDRSDDEVRDVSIVRMAEASWTMPVPLHADGWEIAGCPVNGPALAARGEDVAAVWYTGADDSARVRVAFSADGGRAFGEPIGIDGGRPLGRTGIAVLDDGSAVVIWMEMDGDQAAIRLQRVRPAGEVSDARVLARVSAGRSSGVPQLVRAGPRLLCAWTDPADGGGIRVAAVPLESR